MKLTVEAYTPTGKPEGIEASFKAYAIDLLKKIGNYAESVGDEPIDFEAADPLWSWVTEDSPIELIDAISWAWRTRHDGTGAAGNCIFYVNAPVLEEAKGRITSTVQQGGSTVYLDVTVE